MADSAAHRVAQAPELPPALPPRAEEGAIYARCSGRRDVSRTVDYDLRRCRATSDAASCFASGLPSSGSVAASPPASPLASRPRSKRSLQAVADAAAGSDVDSEASEGSEASVAALLALLGSLQTSVRRLKRRVHALERGAAA